MFDRVTVTKIDLTYDPLPSPSVAGFSCTSTTEAAETYHELRPK